MNKICNSCGYIDRIGILYGGNSYVLNDCSCLIDLFDNYINKIKAGQQVFSCWLQTISRAFNKHFPTCYKCCYAVMILSF